MPTPTRRKYYPLTLVAKPITCFLCAAIAKNQADLQSHMNVAHPGWLDVAVRKILGSAQHSEATKVEENVTVRR